MPADQPGWRPDPERPGQLRWWNGLGWSDARRAADATIDRARAAANDAARGSTLTPQQVARTMLDRSGARAVPSVAGAAALANPLAGAALVLGVLAIVVGGWGLLPIVGIVVSIAGLVRSRAIAREGRRRNTGLGRSLTGLLLSVVGLLRWLPLLAQLGPVLDELLNS